MRKSSLSLLQRFPCPRNQKRTWDLYQRQILKGVKDVKNISLLQTCSVWLRIKPGNPTKENWRFSSATVSRWGDQLRFFRKVSRLKLNLFPGSPGVGRGPGLWRHQRGAKREVLLREGGGPRVHRGPELPQLDEAGAAVHGLAPSPTQVSHGNYKIPHPLYSSSNSLW